MNTQNNPSITIQNVETLTVHYSKGRDPLDSSGASSITGLVDKHTRRLFPSARIHQVIDISAKCISAVSGLCLVALLIIIISGIKQIGVVHIDTLLTIISATFVGGIFSIGGLTLLSLQANLKEQRAIITKLASGDTLKSKLIGSASLTIGWHHFLFPSRELLFVYGHECPAKLFRVDFSNLQSSCIWNYDQEIADRLFAQTATRYKEDLLAVGDYSTGVVGICNLATLDWYQICPYRSIVNGLMFSPDGRRLLITYGHSAKDKTAFVHDVHNRDTIRLPGFAPAAWIDTSTIIMVTSGSAARLPSGDTTVLLRYNVEEKTEQQLYESSTPIRHITSNGQIVVFAECKEEIASEKRETTIRSGPLHGFKYPRMMTEMHCTLEQLEVFNGMLFVATSWNGSVNDTHRLRLFDLGGTLISEFSYDSGHGHGYPKYAYCRAGDDNVLIATTGINGYVPIVNMFNGRRMIVDCNSANNIGDMEEPWISVQLDKREGAGLAMSLINHDGKFALYQINAQNEPSV